MRKQIAAANWKMNLTYQKAEKLLDDILSARIKLAPNQLTIFAVPFPYLILANSEVSGSENYFIAAQNCYDKKSGAYTGEISAEMLESIGIKYCVLGHSERREYFEETNKMLADKIDLCLEYGISPIFCCGEALAVREKNEQNSYVRVQLEESLFHLKPESIKNVIIAYEPIWAIGTGKTATTEQAQEMHQYIRMEKSQKIFPYFMVVALKQIMQLNYLPPRMWMVDW
jgi:triosephosphate isomerase